MTTQELKEYIGRVLGNSIRCLLPSYWWKRLFGLVVDKVDEVDNKVEDLKNKSDYIKFYLTYDPNSEWARKNYESYYKVLMSVSNGKQLPIIISTAHDENFSGSFTDIQITGGVEFNLYELNIPRVSFGRNTCNIHIIPVSEFAVTCEVERLTFDNGAIIPEDNVWGSIKTKELLQELTDVSESVPLTNMSYYDNAEIKDSHAIKNSGPAWIFGFVGNSEIIDGKIKCVNLSSLTVSEPYAALNYELKKGWYDDQGIFNKVSSLNFGNTRICSSEISVNPGVEYTIISETSNFSIEIFEYDAQGSFIQKTFKHLHSSVPGMALAYKDITFTENTNCITFNLYHHGNDISQCDIAFVDGSTDAPIDESRFYYGNTGTTYLSGELHGLLTARDTLIGNVYTKRVGVRDYEEGDVNSDSLLTDGTTTIYALNPDEYKTEIYDSVRGIGFYGTAKGCTISGNIPFGIMSWSNAEREYLTQFGASAKTLDSRIYYDILSKQDSLISGTNIKTINGESILGGGNIEITSEGPSYDDTELRNEVEKMVNKDNVATINGESLINGGNVSVGNIVSIETNDVVDDVDVAYATESYVDEAISRAITSIINSNF